MKKKLIYIIPDLARELNVTASIVFYKIWQWQMSRSRHNRYEKIGGIKAAFRSYSELADDLPWLDRTAIYRAVQSLKEHFGTDFLVEETDKGKSKFLIRSSLAKKYGLNRSHKSGRLSFEPDDAVQHGVIGALILKHCSQNGFSLEEVVVSKLKSIPASTNTIYSALKALKEKKAEIPEPRLTDGELEDKLDSELLEMLKKAASHIKQLASLTGSSQRCLTGKYFRKSGLSELVPTISIDRAVSISGQQDLSPNSGRESVTERDTTTLPKHDITDEERANIATLTTKDFFSLM